MDWNMAMIIMLNLSTDTSVNYDYNKHESRACDHEIKMKTIKCVP